MARLNPEEAELKRRVTDVEAALDAKAYAHYRKLTESEVKAQVVDDKWLAALEAVVHGEMDRVSQQITQRVKELAERYDAPLPRMAAGDGIGGQSAPAPWQDGLFMDVTSGFKQTEVGVIRDDWEVSTVGGEFSIQLGKMLDSEKNVGVAKPFLGNRAA